MADILTKLERSERMSRIRQRHTGPELQVRRGLHALGLRFRLHPQDLPGRPDIVLPKYRTVIFVHGCFWHGHHCRAGGRPTSNKSFWVSKIDANRKRDLRKSRALRKLGWRVLTVWECQLKRSTIATRCIERLHSTVKQQRPLPNARTLLRKPKR
jgi:DNA mismatch endonuclease, patch repair protein